MDADGRQQRILGLARTQGRVEVAELAVQLAISPETVRRDLRRLEDHGVLRRVHGGAYPVENAGFETHLSARVGARVDEKIRIARAAIGCLSDESSVFVDEGYTPQLVAESLPRDRGLTVLTASVPLAASIAGRTDLTVILLGGRVRPNTLATVGSATTGMLGRYVIDLAFLGANGISLTHGLTTPDPAVADVKAQAIRSSRRRVLVGVHSKFGISSFCRFGDLKDIETIVTDDGLSLAEARRYAKRGPHVIRA
ncbi:MAG: DeoR/GlpR transcriptional regulator [Rhodoferax sp.]|nr:DeoR/GlpR transcriptional regulator [Actinomycetota bacterium]